MNDWIDLHALWQIVVLGLVCGAGLPALFAIGLKVLSAGSPDAAAAPAAGAAGGGTAVAARPLNLAAAGICFAVVLAAIGWGIYLIVAGT